MSVETQLADYLEAHLDAMAAACAEQLRGLPDTNYPNIPLAQLQVASRAPFVASIATIRGDPSAITSFSGSTIRQRAERNDITNSQSISQIGDILYGILKTKAQEAFPDDPIAQAQAQVAVAELTYISNRASYQAYVDVREERFNLREAELQSVQADYEQVSAAVRELSAPIAPIHDNILVLPLVGSINQDRATFLTEDLLEEIVARQSDVVIIDITGVPVVDTNIANYLLQTTRAVSLLGAQVILVGISAEIAQTIVGLELDLRQLTVRANLQDGIEYALAQVGLGIMPLQSRTNGA
jgi:anti-anti-sigma regulatory factor